jgi:hypothetical protein
MGSHVMSLQSHKENPSALTALLPLFYEKAVTPAMIKHGMDVMRETITFLNPGQIPVITFDQLLFALAKFVQWQWPVMHGEGVHVAMLGGLHTEMALWNCLGDTLEVSGWTSALVEAGVASPGKIIIDGETDQNDIDLITVADVLEKVTESLQNLIHEEKSENVPPTEETTYMDVFESLRVYFTHYVVYAKFIGTFSPCIGAPTLQNDFRGKNHNSARKLLPVII